MIVLSSAAGAIVIAAALAIPEVSNAPRDAIGSTLLPHVFALVVAAIAVYALCAMLLATAALVAGSLRVRQQLLRATADRTLSPRQWVAVLGANGFRQLAARLAPMLVQAGGADGRVMLQTWFNPDETRSEVARLYYISLARSHFFSALIVLAGVVGLGLAQDRGSLLLLPGAIPTASAILILVGLLLLAALGRIVIDVTAEPLIETIAQLPTERIEVALLRRAVELLDVARAAPASQQQATAATPPQLLEGLVAVIEKSHRAVLDAVNRLTANTQTLEAAVRSSAEIVATMEHAAAAPQQPIDGLPELQGAVEELTAVIRDLNGAPREVASGNSAAIPQQSIDGLPELRGAVEELTAVIRGLNLPPAEAPRSETPQPQLAREIQQLLQEIEGAR
jgi:methyl-accepting chemotaxis protein